MVPLQREPAPRASAEPHPGRPDYPPMLTPSNAYRMLLHRTGGRISRATFYRWISSGRVFSIRLGFRIYIPLIEIDSLVKQCRAGERI